MKKRILIIISIIVVLSIVALSIFILNDYFRYRLDIGYKPVEYKTMQVKGEWAAYSRPKIIKTYDEFKKYVIDVSEIKFVTEGGDVIEYFNKEYFDKHSLVITGNSIDITQIGKNKNKLQILGYAKSFTWEIENYSTYFIEADKDIEAISLKTKPYEISYDVVF